MQHYNAGNDHNVLKDYNCSSYYNFNHKGYDALGIFFTLVIHLKVEQIRKKMFMTFVKPGSE